MAKSLIQTCSLCANFDPLKKSCLLNGEKREAHDMNYAVDCKIAGTFIRYMHVIPDSYNYFSIDEDTPHNWSPDLSKVPKDINGLPLIVKTKRGIERAIPCNSSVSLTVDTDIEGKVPAIFTYQGQRELIYEYGVSIASAEAVKAGVPLTILPEESGWNGIPEMVSFYLAATKSYDRGGMAWLTNKPVKWNN